MEKSTNENERLRYNRLILESENYIDKLCLSKGKLEDTVADLDDEIHAGFQKLSLLIDEQSEYAGSSSILEQQKNDEQKQIFRNLVGEANDEIALAYNKEISNANKKREDLLKKRSDIPWD